MLYALQINIGSVNGLAPTKWQANISTHADPFHWRIGVVRYNDMSWSKPQLSMWNWINALINFDVKLEV